MSIKYFISVPNTHDVFVTFTKGVVSLLELVRHPTTCGNAATATTDAERDGLDGGRYDHRSPQPQPQQIRGTAVTPTTLRGGGTRDPYTAVQPLGSGDEQSTNTSLDATARPVSAAAGLLSRRPLSTAATTTVRLVENDGVDDDALAQSGDDWASPLMGPAAHTTTFSAAGERGILERMASLDSMFQFPSTPQLRPVLEDHYIRHASEDAMLLLGESMTNVSNASIDHTGTGVVGGEDSGDGAAVPTFHPIPEAATGFPNQRGNRGQQHRRVLPSTTRPPHQEEGGRGGSRCIPIVRSSVRLPHDVVATCFCPSAPVERQLLAELDGTRGGPLQANDDRDGRVGDMLGDSGCDVFVAVGTRSGMLAVVRCGRLQSEQQVVARCTPPHVAVHSPSTAGGGGGDTASGGTAGSNTSAFQNFVLEDNEWDSCTTVVWVREQPIIGVGHASGRIAWYYVEASSSHSSAAMAPLYGNQHNRAPMHPSSGSSVGGGVVVTLTHVATYPAYMSNKMAYVASSNELTCGGLVVFSTHEEVLLFDVHNNGASSSATMEVAAATTRRQRSSSLERGGGGYSGCTVATWRGAIALRYGGASSPTATRNPGYVCGGYDTQRLTRTVGVLPRGGDYVACHPSLPYFALLGRGKPPHVSESGTMSSAPGGGGPSRHAATTIAESPPATPATATPPSTATTPLHLQIFEVRKQVAYACGAARLVRQSIRTDAILDAAWRFSADLTLLVNISDESNLRLYHFAYQPQQQQQQQHDGATVHTSPVAASHPFHASSSSQLQWGDRIVPFASHGAIVNVEWMSAAASCFNQLHRDVVLAREGRQYAPGFGEASHVVGVGLRGEIAVTTILPDPAVSWCDDHQVLVGTGSTLCLFGTAGPADGSGSGGMQVQTSSSAKNNNQAAVNLSANDPTSCGVAVEAMMVARSEAGFGIDPRLCEKALASFRVAVATGGGGRKLPPPTFLEILCRYMTALERVGVCSAHGRVPGVLQWLSFPHDSVPTHDQLLEAGMYSKDSIFECPSSLSATHSYFGGGHHQTTRENDPRRILLLYVFGWIPTPPPNRAPLGAGGGSGGKASLAATGNSSGGSALSNNNSYVRVTTPWLTDVDDVERLAAILVYYGQLQEAAAVLHVHHALQPAFAPIAGLLLTMHTNRSAQQQQQQQAMHHHHHQSGGVGSSSTQRFPSTAGVSDPMTNRVLSALPEGISNAMGPELYAAITDACTGPPPPTTSSNWGGDLSTIASTSCCSSSAGSYDDPSLSTIDRIMIAVLKHPNISELMDTLRTCFLTSNCNLVLRLLLEGVHEGTVPLIQRHVDVTGDVQLAACLFARIGVSHTTSTTGGGGGGAGPFDGRPKSASTSAAVWSAWAATYRGFLMDRGLFVQRALFDIHVKRMEASAQGGRGAVAASAARPRGRQDVDVVQPDDADCVCRGTTSHMRPGHAQTVAAAARQCCVCGESLAPGLGGSQAARAHFRQVAAFGSIEHIGGDGPTPTTSNASRLTMLMRTAFVWCTVCGHGGHVSHLQAWFANHAHCASSGCTCKCAASQSR